MIPQNSYFLWYLFFFSPNNLNNKAPKPELMLFTFTFTRDNVITWRQYLYNEHKARRSGNTCVDSSELVIIGRNFFYKLYVCKTYS